MPQIPTWNISQIKQCEVQTEQAMLNDEHTLVLFNHDFGNLMNATPSAVCIPKNAQQLQKIIQYANENDLPLTIRGNGLSQCGQSLAPNGGMLLSMQCFNAACFKEDNAIWVEANASWAQVLEESLKERQVPPIVPYNCNLSVGGVISAGGVGASSFKYGSIVSHVGKLEVITADGNLQKIDKSSPLFHACLGGQGRFALITKACLQLRPCKNNVRTFFLVYLDKESCFNDLKKFQQKADFIECFCSPSLQGAKLSEKGRKPFAQWLFAMHVAVEFDDKPPSLSALNPQVKAWRTLHVQDEPIKSYLHRHDSRFEGMKLSGQWDMQHPWYECFIPHEVLQANLDDILDFLPLHYATVLQIVPMANSVPSGFFMLPEENDIFAIMILNPGLPKTLVPSCMDTILALDKLLLPQGGKRYLSGYLGADIPEVYWKKHFDSHYEAWLSLKAHYDPHAIFCSLLHRG